MAPRRRWLLFTSYMAAVELALLIAQYLLGLLTNLYGPAVYADRNGPPSLGFHFLTGYLLFLVGAVILIFSGLARSARLIIPAVVLEIAILLAGIFGSLFLGTNNPIYSFGMGTMFLVALFSAIAFLAFSWRARTTGPVVPSSATHGSQGA